MNNFALSRLILLVVMSLCLTTLSESAYEPNHCETWRSQVQDRSPVRTFNNYLSCRRDKNIGQDVDLEFEKNLLNKLTDEFKKLGNSQQERSDKLRSTIENWPIEYKNDVTFDLSKPINDVLIEQFAGRVNHSHWQGPSQSCDQVLSSRASDQMMREFIEIYQQRESPNKLAQNFNNFFKIGNPMRRAYGTILLDAHKSESSPRPLKITLGTSDMTKHLKTQEVRLMAALFHEFKRTSQQQSQDTCDLKTLETLASVFNCFDIQSMRPETVNALSKVFGIIGEWLNKCVEKTFEVYEKKLDRKAIRKLMSALGIFKVTHDQEFGVVLVEKITNGMLGETRDFLNAFENAEKRAQSAPALIELVQSKDIRNVCQRIDAPQLRRKLALLVHMLLVSSRRVFSSQTDKLAVKLFKENAGLSMSLFFCNVLELASVNGDQIQLLDDYENFGRNWPFSV